MIQYRYQADLSGLTGLSRDQLVKATPNIQMALQKTASAVALMWQDAVKQAHLWNVEKQAYMASIRWEMNGPLEAWVGTDYKPAQDIETGRPPRDLKQVLPRAKKARTVAHGKHAGMKYLIIPFRHNIPSASGVGAHAPQMPLKVYALAKDLSPSRVLPLGSKKPPTRLGANGHTVLQQSYSWGERLRPDLMPKAKPHHATDLYAGMVRFDTSSGKPSSSAYLTFRTMGEWSSGWIVPARPGLYIARNVADLATPVFENIIRRAVEVS